MKANTIFATAIIATFSYGIKIENQTSVDLESGAEI
jgi:hypothetical protein